MIAIALIALAKSFYVYNDAINILFTREKWATTYGQSRKKKSYWRNFIRTWTVKNYLETINAKSWNASILSWNTDLGRKLKIVYATTKILEHAKESEAQFEIIDSDFLQNLYLEYLNTWTSKL